VGLENTDTICTSAHCTGIEIEPSYIDSARKCESSLHLSNARFIQAAARAADLSNGTLCYLYTPFTGSILRHVLDSLRQQALGRKTRVATYGPCTQFVAEEPCLHASTPIDPDRIAIFSSRM